MVVRFLRRTAKTVLPSLALSSVLAATANAEPGSKPPCTPYYPSPGHAIPLPAPSVTPAPSTTPGTTTTPGSATTPGTTTPGTATTPGSTTPGSGTTPDSGTSAANTNAAAADTPAADSADSGTAGGETAAITMFGDAFGSRSMTITAASFRPLNTVLGGTFFGREGGTSITASNPTFNGASLGLSSVSYLLISPAMLPGSSSQLTDLVLQENASVSAALAKLVAQPGESLLFQSATGINGRGVDSGSPGSQGGINVDYAYNVALQYLLRSQVTIVANNPSGGGVAGRTKISDDNSPLPRDRFIFNFDYFDNVPLNATGVDVKRYSPGIEKTFFNQMTSVEVRFPFASTLSSEVLADGFGSSATEFGNINVTLKALVYNSDEFRVATGLGIALPTADDTSVRLLNGSELVRINNDAVILTPYAAALWTPCSPFFAQAWVQLGVDANGNETLANPTLNNLQFAGRLTDQSLLQTDLQVGYWVVQNNYEGSWLRGLAPFVELHYNTTVTDADTVSLGGLTIGDSNFDVSELNVTTGVLAQLGNNLNMSAGLVLPLKDSPDRFFDYQFGVRASYFFGPTARSRSAATQVSGF